MRRAVLIPATMLLVAATAPEMHAQNNDFHIVSPESTAVMAGERYRASRVVRTLLGDTWRDLWATSIKVPVLDIHTFADGARAVAVETGSSTRLLRIRGRDGRDFVFRLTDKHRLGTPYPFKGTLVDKIFRDQVSALHPAGALISDPILTAAKIPHPSPAFAVVPNSALPPGVGSDVAGKLGIIEEVPSVPPDTVGFADASEIIESKHLLRLLNSDPMQRVDARAMLKARLADILLGDNDRHPAQWKWARMNDARPARWVPIPHDRDHAFVNFDGALLKLARGLLAPTLIVFEGADINLEALTEHRGFDNRMLAELDRAAWDSVATELVGQVTDSVIDAAVARQPPEYAPVAPAIAAGLKERRDRLHGAAMAWYGAMATAPEIHATDAADRLVVSRIDDRFVHVALETTAGKRYFERSFDSLETTQIRIYLHGGNDTAIVKGNVRRGIAVRIIGGNGTNTLVDSSLVNGKPKARFYDAGTVTSVSYGEDTLFNRKPMVKREGRLQPPGPDRGSRWVPLVGLSRPSVLGVTPMVGVSRYDYGFQHSPYISHIRFTAEYATQFSGWALTLEGDRRLERSPLHIVGIARMSDLQLVSHRGLGNMLPVETAGSRFFEARQRQWMVRPALGFSLRPGTDISIGPIVQYSTTDSVPNRFISEARPYGFGEFGQAGVRLNLHLDIPAGVRTLIPLDGERPIRPRPLHRFVTNLEATHYPEVWSVKSAFTSVAATAGSSLTLPLPAKPVLVLRGGAKMLFGQFPFHEAAFIGGRNAARSVGFQSFEGDAAVYGSAELRLPLARSSFLLPLEGGPMAAGDASRVFVDGSSPGGWHGVVGGGLWVGLRDSPYVFTLTLMNGDGRRGISMRSGLTLR